MKYKHTNIGQFPIRIWDSKNKDYSLCPGEKCIIDVKRINTDLMIEEIIEKKQTKKENNNYKED